MIDKYFNKRLISLDEALKATHNEIYWTESQQAAVRSFLVKQPRVDAVEVVRCKDCKHWSVDQYGCVCNLHSEKENADYPAFEIQMLPTDFCSYGERKDNETTESV